MTSRRSAESRQRIIEAAAEIAAEQGYDGTTIANVTRRCGLPASSIYWFFKDKDDLLAAVVTHTLEHWSAEQPPWPDPEPGAPVGATVRAALTPAYHHIAEAPDLMRFGFMLLLESREVEPTARTRFREVREGVLRHTRQAFDTLLTGRVVEERDQLLDRLAQLVLAATDGLFLSGRLGVTVDVGDYVDLLAGVVEQAVADAEHADAEHAAAEDAAAGVATAAVGQREKSGSWGKMAP